MAALVEGVQYGLSSQASFNENKQLIFVKLTDSASKAIEDYLRYRNKTADKLTIQFLKNEGRINIPSDQTGHDQSFNFSISSTVDIEGPQGSFECIQQCGSRALESYGALPFKMRILAKEDVYETTRQRVAIAEEASKKNCTQVIKANTFDIGRKVKVKKGIPPSTRPSPPRHPSIRHNPPKPSVPPNGYHQPVNNDYHHHNSHGVNHRIANNHTTNATNGTAKNQGHPELMKRPLRERIVQLLAVKPYKKPEILIRLYRDGIREKEKKFVMPTLNQVAQLSDNTYNLLRHVWNDVNEDWTFYTEQEKVTLKRRKPQNLTPPGSDSSVGSSQSPSSTSHPHTSPPMTLKRPGYFDSMSNIPTKKQRISHYKRPPDYVNNNTTSPALPKPDSTSSRQVADSYRSPSVVPNGRPPEISVGEDVLHGKYSPSEKKRFKKDIPTNQHSISNKTLNLDTPIQPKCSPLSSVSSGVNTPNLSPDSQIEIAENEGSNHLAKYNPIECWEQRSAYKCEFNAAYGEYKDLHMEVERVSKRFAQLEMDLQQVPKDTEAWKGVKDQILKEYQANKQDRKYQEARKRFTYLHQKLSHIKQLIVEYDGNQVNIMVH